MILAQVYFKSYFYSEEIGKIHLELKLEFPKHKQCSHSSISWKMGRFPEMSSFGATVEQEQVEAEMVPMDIYKYLGMSPMCVCFSLGFYC